MHVGHNDPRNFVTISEGAHSHWCGLIATKTIQCSVSSHHPNHTLLEISDTESERRMPIGLKGRGSEAPERLTSFLLIDAAEHRESHQPHCFVIECLSW